MEVGAVDQFTIVVVDQERLADGFHRLPIAVVQGSGYQLVHIPKIQVRRKLVEPVNGPNVHRTGGIVDGEVADGMRDGVERSTTHLVSRHRRNGCRTRS